MEAINLFVYRQNAQKNRKYYPDGQKLFGKYPLVQRKIIHSAAKCEQQSSQRKGDPAGTFLCSGLCRTGTAAVDAELIFVMQISATGCTIHGYHLVPTL